MDDVILKVDNISKQYRLGLVGTGTLTHDLNRFWHKIRGKEDPYLQIGAVNDRSATASSDYVWALQDINFEVKRGEILGIIGKNGAGKSTLLKILSRVTSPTTGSIKTKGRIASLLEVGTGMHPELTGRENIYLNGAILGMNKTEISCKIDEIIEFSGCQMYIDTPVKRYSSGMRVRLGFAVAAFLEPDILVVDEVLAVGDVEFQKKAIGKMQDISNTSGRTVLFVSHNMASIQNLCTSAIMLNNGGIAIEGTVDEVIAEYLKSSSKIQSSNLTNLERKGNGVFQFVGYKIMDLNYKLSGNTVQSGSPIEIHLDYISRKAISIKKCRISVGVRDNYDTLLFNCPTNILNTEIDIQEKGTLVCRIPKLPLKEGRYKFNLFAEIQNEIADWINDAGYLDVVASDFYGTGVLPDNNKGVLIEYGWDKL